MGSCGGPAFTEFPRPDPDGFAPLRYQNRFWQFGSKSMYKIWGSGVQGLGPQKLLVNPPRQIRNLGLSSDMSGVLMVVVGVANIFVTDTRAFQN